MPDEKFVRPIHLVQGEDVFKANEVGLTHPNTKAFVRLKDNGDIELVADDGLAIIMHPAKRSITIIADTVKFLTKSNKGLRWNSTAFNEHAVSFNEPTLIPVSDEDGYGMYKGVEHFMYDPANQGATEESMPGVPPDIAAKLSSSATVSFPQIMVNDPVTGTQMSYEQYFTTYGKPPPFGQNGK